MARFDCHSHLTSHPAGCQGTGCFYGRQVMFFGGLGADCLAYTLGWKWARTIIGAGREAQQGCSVCVIQSLIISVHCLGRRLLSPSTVSRHRLLSPPTVCRFLLLSRPLFLCRCRLLSQSTFCRHSLSPPSTTFEKLLPKRHLRQDEACQLLALSLMQCSL